LGIESVCVLVCVAQRIVRMNKTEDDEMDAEELTEEELKQVAGAFFHTAALLLISCCCRLL